MDKEKYKYIPGVDVILNDKRIKQLLQNFGHELITAMIRMVLEKVRTSIGSGGDVPTIEQILIDIDKHIKDLSSPSLKKVINATGVIIHTNLGRAPLGQRIYEDLKDVILGYSNLEFDLKKGERGHRNAHIGPLLKIICGAEEALVVNNNAAGIILALNTLASSREVILSRGELVEIGGSFRIPEIMAASGAKMVEVGTTNKTHLSDYEKAINDRTAMILKVHKSNYSINGFTAEVGLKDLAKIAHSRGLPLMYDIGSGLLRKLKNLNLPGEPDVKTSISAGADLVTFSADKLLGGPQAGIIAGKKKWVFPLSQAPMMRAMRVGKLTLAALSTVCRAYLQGQNLAETIPVFSMLEQPQNQLKKNAQEFFNKLSDVNVKADIIKNKAHSGGGTLPSIDIDSVALKLIFDFQSQKERARAAEKVYFRLLNLDYPIIGILRQGELLFDILTIPDSEFSYIASAIKQAIISERKK